VGACRRVSQLSDGPWHITARAVRDYAVLARLDDLERARDELVQLSARAHLVRRQSNGLQLWRVKAFHGRRIRLLVGEPAVRFPGALPSLVRVLGEL
jgi:hypothetical protein